MAEAQTSQVAVEVLESGDAKHRTSQVAVEALLTASANHRMSQIVIEVLVPNAVIAQAGARSYVIWVE